MTNNYDKPTAEDLEEIYNDKRFIKKNSRIINYKYKNEEDERVHN